MSTLTQMFAASAMLLTTSLSEAAFLDINQIGDDSMLENYSTSEVTFTTVSGSPRVFAFQNPDNFDGIALYGGTDAAIGAFTIHFSKPVAALTLNIAPVSVSSIDTFNGLLPFVKTTLFHHGTAVGGSSFAGVADAFTSSATAFSSVLVNYQEGLGNSDNFIIGVDSIDYTFAAAAPIPEPDAYAMMLIGLGLLGCATRRRRAGAAKLAA